MTPVSLAGTASAMPEEIVDNRLFMEASGLKRNLFFRGTKLRRHMARNETAVSLIVKASRKLSEDININLSKDVDIILTNVSIPDLPFTGCGAHVADELGCTPQWIIDNHSGGCVAFVIMMAQAQALMNASNATSALICTVQTSGGRVFRHPENLKLPQSAVPGDGCGVGYLVKNNESPVKTVLHKVFGKYANDMTYDSNDHRHYWEPGPCPFYISFDEKRIASIMGRANKFVPEILNEACLQADLSPEEIDVLITNQPSRILLRNWQESVQIPPEKHIHTFEEYGNLFGAAIPINFEKGVENRDIQPGNHVLIGGFSHAGDYTASAVVHWRP